MSDYDLFLYVRGCVSFSWWQNEMDSLFEQQRAALSEEKKKKLEKSRSEGGIEPLWR